MTTDRLEVTLLLNCRGEVLSVYESEENAQKRADKYNADPFIEPGTPDADAPYRTQSWVVQR